MSRRVLTAAGLTGSMQSVWRGTTSTCLSVVRFQSCPHMEPFGSEVALSQVPARTSVQRGLTYAEVCTTSGVECIDAQAFIVGACAKMGCTHSENNRVS